MTINTNEYYIEIKADDGKTLHRPDDIYCKEACLPLGSDTTAWEEIPDADVPPEDDGEKDDEFYREAGRILLGDGN